MTLFIPNPVTELALCDVAVERVAQDRKWGEQNHPNGTGSQYEHLATEAKRLTDEHAELGSITYADILREEFWEAMAESDPEKLRAELIQVAAVAVAWVEKIDRDANE